MLKLEVKSRKNYNMCVLEMVEKFESNQLKCVFNGCDLDLETKRELYYSLKREGLKFHFYGDESIHVFLDRRVLNLKIDSNVIFVDFKNKKAQLNGN